MNPFRGQHFYLQHNWSLSLGEQVLNRPRTKSNVKQTCVGSITKGCWAHYCIPGSQGLRTNKGQPPRLNCGKFCYDPLQVFVYQIPTCQEIAFSQVSPRVNEVFKKLYAFILFYSTLNDLTSETTCGVLRFQVPQELFMLVYRSTTSSSYYSNERGCCRTSIVISEMFVINITCWWFVVSSVPNGYLHSGLGILVKRYYDLCLTYLHI